MKLMLILFTLGALIGGFNDIATVNRLKQEAEAALQQKEYQKAARYYSQLVDSLQVDDDAVRMNLAHALLLAGDTATAQRTYSTLTSSQDRPLKSVAYQQMGVVASAQQKYPEALAIFKESLKANPTNEEARYNYELVKKLLEQQQEQEQEQEQEQQEQSEDQEQNEQNQEEQKEQEQKGDEQASEQNQEGEESEQEGEPGEQSEESESQDPSEREAQEGETGEESEEPSPSPTAEKLKEMNISEEKARMILEAMRNNEMQYIQQNRRKPQKPRDRTKPDW